MKKSSCSVLYLSEDIDGRDGLRIMLRNRYRKMKVVYHVNCTGRKRRVEIRIVDMGETIRKWKKKTLLEYGEGKEVK